MIHYVLFMLYILYINKIYLKNRDIKKARVCGLLLAEREGFEPPDLLQSTVFKTAAFDHSAISPGAKVQKEIYLPNIFLKIF